MAPSPPTTILFTHYGDDWIRGSERCLLDLLRYLDRSLFYPVLWCNSETMARAAAPLGIPVEVSPLPVLFSSRKPRFSIAAYCRLLRRGLDIVDKYGAKLIHANSGAPSQCLNIIARARHLPLISHLHSPYPLHQRLILGLHHASISVAPSHAVIEQLRGDGVPVECSRVINNGIDHTTLDKQRSFALRSALNITEDDFVIATTASLIHRKGIDLIIRALNEVRNKKLPAQLVIIGEGPERQALEELSNALALGPYIHFLGEQDEVSGLLRSGIDLFISAARQEAFGLVLAEASLAGLPLVAPAVGGIPEVVLHEQTGLLVPPEDIQALAASIVQLYADPELRMTLGKAGRHHVLQHFTIERNVAQFTRLYQRCLAQSGLSMAWHRHWRWHQISVKICAQILALARRKVCALFKRAPAPLTTSTGMKGDVGGRQQ
ncbi:MAG: glycosyltransferase family 4 protein [Porticoccaceae bacterium]|nr:glycosyltransferase family 4 protein [Porticoccaceae bacterium]